MVCDPFLSANTVSLSYLRYRRTAMIYNKTTLWWRVSFVLVFVAFAGVYELASPCMAVTDGLPVATSDLDSSHCCE